VEIPVVEASALPDTADTAGPYAVSARVTARRPINHVELVFHDVAAGASATRVEMSQQGDLWTASIPGYGHGARIAWHVEALDEEGDRGTAPPNATTGCASEYCFSVTP
jgi:hypothetical protein